MKKIGEALHIGPNNKVIAKVSSPIRLGETVFDVRKKPIGIVLDIFGPVKAPYVEIEVKNQKPEKVINSPLYVLPKYKRLKGKRWR